MGSRIIFRLFTKYFAVAVVAKCAHDRIPSRLHHLA